jgi:hypothetical protein
MRRVLQLLVACTILVGTAGRNVFAQKTDFVVLHSGEDVVGEIKSLARGRLEYDTDDLGTISIEWDKISQIRSKNQFEIELADASDYIGHIENGAENGELVIVTDSERVYLRTENIVRITPLGTSFLKRIDGSIDVGLDVTRTNNQKIWNFHGKLSFRSHKWNSALEGSSFLNAQDSVSTSTRNTITYKVQRLIRQSSWSAAGLVSAEQNDELNLSRRLTLGLTGGKFFIQTNRMIFQGFLGIASTDELFFGESSSAQNLEALIALDFELFQFANPEVDFSTQWTVFASITNPGRLRPEFDLSLSWEVFKSVDVGLKGYIQGDTQPAEAARNLDYALTMTFGYSWD